MQASEEDFHPPPPPAQMLQESPARLETTPNNDLRSDRPSSGIKQESKKPKAIQVLISFAIYLLLLTIKMIYVLHLI